MLREGVWGRGTARPGGSAFPPVRCQISSVILLTARCNECSQLSAVSVVNSNRRRIKSSREGKEPPARHGQQGGSCSAEPSIQACTRPRIWLQTRKWGSRCVARRRSSLLFSACASHPESQLPRTLYKPSPSLWLFPSPGSTHHPFLFCPCLTEVQGWRMACAGPPSRAPKPTAPPVHTGSTPRAASVDGVGRRGEQ